MIGKLTNAQKKHGKNQKYLLHGFFQKKECQLLFYLLQKLYKWQRNPVENK
jgi:hypothetical protein